MDRQLRCESRRLEVFFHSLRSTMCFCRRYRKAILLSTIMLAAGLPRAEETTASQGVEVVFRWREVYLFDGKPIVLRGEQIRNKVTGQAFTMYYDQNDNMMPTEFLAQNQKQWQTSQVAETGADKKPAQEPLVKGRPKSVEEKIVPRLVVSLGPVDLTKVLEEDKKNSSKAKAPRRTGIFRDLPTTVTVSSEQGQAPQWVDLKNGGKLWAMTLHSPGAEAIRVHLERVRLPKGVQVMAYDTNDPTECYGPYDSAYLRGRTQFWTESVFASSVTLECYVPPDVDARAVRFEIRQIVHVYVKLANFLKEGTCHNDVSCYSDWTVTGDAVAGIGTIGYSGSLWCTGCLLNDRDPSTYIDYFITANHCVADQWEADDLEFYWFYQTNTCDGNPPDPVTVPRTSGGADFLAGMSRADGSDFSFLRTRNITPDGVVYAGWTTASPSDQDTLTTIHHPDGSYKRISFGQLYNYTTDFWEILWGSGTTEPGSSGCPLFDPNQRFIGQLYGGDAACDNMSGTDEYGRFDVTYPIIEPWLENTQQDDNYEENDSMAQAYDLSGREQQWLSTINGLGVQRDDDWYRIAAPTGTQRILVDCRFTHADGDIDIALYNASGTRVALSNGTQDNEYIDYAASGAGTYYIRVYYENRGNTYDLWWDAVAGSHAVSTPNTPNGPTNGQANTSYSYGTGGATCNQGHAVQYLFDWGNQTDSGWLPVGTTNASKSWPAGNYTVSAKARCATDTGIESGWSGGLPVTISGVTGTPDITAPQFYFASWTPTEGDPYYVESDITNGGDGVAGASHARFFISPGDDFDTADDYEITPEKSVPALPVGETVRIRWDFNFPNLADTPTYDCWFLCYVDCRDEVAESDEANLWKMNSPITVANRSAGTPNLTVSAGNFSPAAPTQLQPGSAVTLSAYIQNNGQGPAGPFWLEFWGSRTGGLMLDNPNMVVYSEWISGLEAGQGRNINVTKPLASIPDGPYTVTFVVDRPGEIEESEEYDNRYIVSGKRLLVIRPQTNADLVVENFSFSPNPIGNGQQIYLGGQVRNSGTQNSGVFWIEFWGSYPVLYPDLHVMLCDSIKVNDLPPGGVVRLADYPRSLYAVPSGTFWVICFADRPDAVNERNETNNYQCIPNYRFNSPVPSKEAADNATTGVHEQQLADLVITNFDFSPSAPTQGQPGGIVTIWITIANQGSADAGPFWLEWWGSQLGGLNIWPLLLDQSEYLPGLRAGESRTMTLYKPLMGVPDGPYTVVAVVDRLGQVAESNESNNRRAASGKRMLVIRPSSGANLDLESFDVASNPLTPGQVFYPTGTVRNAGTANSGEFWIEFWGSTQQGYPQTDFMLCDSIKINNLAPGEVVYLSLYPRTAYSDLPGGSCAIGCFVDRIDQVNETNESDNYWFLSNRQIGP